MPTSPSCRRPASVRVPVLTLGLCALFAVGGDQRLAAQNAPDVASLLTRAEATDWIETSRYDDVVALLRAVADADPGDDIHLTTMGYSMEGRAIPLLVVGADGPSPAAVRASGRLRVYLQGNIHGGEVPGKEALQMLARELASGARPAWRDHLVLLIAPIYNVDGNERVSLVNRPRQHGPIGGMGQRPNAMELDLNRDHMKLDSPEARSFAAMLTAFDPEVGVDLHTTNGTRHAYHLTYSPPLHPGVSPAILDLLNGEALPRISERVLASDGWYFHHYGNTRRTTGPTGEEELGWFTFDHRPRFNNNYVGLRNRFAFLGEAYAYATFEERTRATGRFVDEILAWAADARTAIRAAIAEAERPVVGERLPTRATFAAADTLSTILLGEVDEEHHPYTGEVILRRRDVVLPTPMREYITFAATDTEVAPAAYLVPADMAPVLDRLAAHGVRTSVMPAERTLEVEVFMLDSTRVAERPFQGHNEVEAFGRWERTTRAVPAGTVEVALDQPLGRLAFHLLEPRSDDGLVNWGLVDRWLNGPEFAIVRVPAPRN